MDEEEKQFRTDVSVVYKNIDKHLPSESFPNVKFIKFFPNGISSVVGLIESGNQKYVIKSTRWPKNVLREARFLQIWQQAGIKVPHYYGKFPAPTRFEGTVLAVYEYIDASSAKNYFAENPAESDLSTWKSIADQLIKMSKHSATGFGKAVGENFDQGELPTLHDYIQSKLKPEDIDYLASESVLTPTQLAYVTRIISETKQKDYPSVYTHNDLGLHNVLDHGENLVIFDPFPVITHPYMELAVSYIWAVIQGQTPKSAEVLLETYSHQDPEFDLKTFNQFLLIRVLSKQVYWLRMQESDPISKIMLEKTLPLSSSLLK